MDTQQSYPDTGFLEIDVEHRAISRQMSNVLDAINGNRVAEIADLMTSMFVQVSQHFAHEERLMRENNYPKLEPHSDAHASFLRDATGFRAEFVKLGLTPAFRRWATGRMLKWFRFHIMAHDVELGLFLSAEPKPGNVHP